MPKKKEDDAETAAPSKLALGVEGGFALGAEYDIEKTHTLVVIAAVGTDASVEPAVHTIALPNGDLPEMVSNVLQAIIDHAGMRVVPHHSL